MASNLGMLLLCFLAAGFFLLTNADVSLKDLRKGKRVGQFKISASAKIPGIKGANVWTYDEFKKDKPISSGLKFTPKYITNILKLPCVLIHPDVQGPLNTSCMSTTWMKFNKGSPFKAMQITYANGGHLPVGVFDKPHFDLHFYRISKEEIYKTTDPATNGGVCPPGFNPETFAKINKPLPVQCYPKGYTNVNEAVPLMGNHLVDLNDKAFKNPGSYDKTWIYGVFDGKITFFEPMIIPEVLLNASKSFCGPIPAFPKEFHKAGWYPTTFCHYMTYDKKYIHVELRDFVWKKAGCTKADKGYDGYLAVPIPNLPAECVYDKPPSGR